MPSSRLFWKLLLACGMLSLVAAAVLASARSEWYWALLAIVGFGVIALAYWLIAHVIRPLNSLIKAAEAIASGDYTQRVYVENRDELGTLARTFNRMSQELNARMTQLSQTGDRQATVLGGMIEGVIAVDGRQRIVLANRAAGRLFDFRPPTAEGRTLLEVVRNHAVYEAVTKALATRQPQRLETKSGIQHPAASIQHLNVHVQPLPGEPCPGVVLVMHDTTELRRLESLRRDFIANVSHELKTPLTSIKAYSETLRNGAMNDPEASQRFLARIEEQSDRLHHLILDMLMLARIESDQQAFEIVPVDVAQVASSALENQRPAAEAKRLQLELEPSESPCRVRADYEGLREILDNLIDNAIKYTPEGGKVTVSWNGRHSASRSEDRGARSENNPVRISVRDTGIGIKPEDQRRVFERFYRVDKARSRELG
ncbi:MAG TPA: histidine kinase dimerization/phospho-acceptor domain-containing protein, partial [Lacipirellulaceae bacterium]|nr:histidine kinase dimerization/phospho-acceptor domain-containing protein [Lacipirellulaceae bacterium]